MQKPLSALFPIADHAEAPASALPSQAAPSADPAAFIHTARTSRCCCCYGAAVDMLHDIWVCARWTRTARGLCAECKLALVLLLRPCMQLLGGCAQLQFRAAGAPSDGGSYAPSYRRHWQCQDQEAAAGTGVYPALGVLANASCQRCSTLHALKSAPNRLCMEGCCK